jgi:NADPH:quinone reductase-like Zn-dependent oxidoreductase
MRAVVQRGYGPPQQVLDVTDVPLPVPNVDEVLIRVRAASVHPDVWHVVHGLPRILRIMGAGLFRPRVPVPGTDAAGIVAAVGGAVTHIEVGEEVYGETVRGHQWKNGGAFAEYVTAPASAVAPKPAGLDFAEAAAIPTSAYIAAANMGHLVAPGTRALINGAAGGVGMFCLQIAKALGGSVTGVDRGDKAELMRELGADSVVDYTTEDFTSDRDGYDLIVDIPGNRSFDDIARVLRPGGRYVLIGHEGFTTSRNRLLGATIPRMLRLGTRRPFGRSPAVPKAERPDPRELTHRLVAQGAIRAVVDPTVFGLADVPAALTHLESGAATGKVVLRV